MQVIYLIFWYRLEYNDRTYIKWELVDHLLRDEGIYTSDKIYSTG